MSIDSKNCDEDEPIKVLFDVISNHILRNFEKLTDDWKSNNEKQQLK